MEDINCPLCESRDRNFLWSKGSARYYRCSECGLVYETPRLTSDELRALYSSETYYLDERNENDVIGYTDYFAQVTPGLTKEYFSILENSIQGRANPRLLDFGSGPGLLMMEAQQRGWDVVGVEVSRWAADHGRKAGLDIREGSIRELALEPRSFDVVSMFDVLEHLSSPKTDLAEIHRVLKGNGAVVAETPNIDGFFAKRLYREQSELVKPRAHICLYSPATLRRLFLETGFTKLEISTFPYCRRYTPGYLKRLLTSRMYRSEKRVQLTWNESLRIIARK